MKKAVLEDIKMDRVHPLADSTLFDRLHERLH